MQACSWQDSQGPAEVLSTGRTSHSRHYKNRWVSKGCDRLAKARVSLEDIKCSESQ